MSLTMVVVQRFLVDFQCVFYWCWYCILSQYWDIFLPSLQQCGFTDESDRANNYDDSPTFHQVISGQKFKLSNIFCTYFFETSVHPDQHSNAILTLMKGLFVWINPCQLMFLLKHSYYPRLDSGLKLQVLLNWLASENNLMIQKFKHHLTSSLKKEMRQK